MKKTVVVLAMIALGMSSCTETNQVDEVIEVENLTDVINQAIDSATTNITDSIEELVDSTSSDLIEMIKTEVEVDQ